MLQRKAIFFFYSMVIFSAMSLKAADLFESRMDFSREPSLYEQAVMTADEIINSLPKIENFSVMLAPKEHSTIPKHLLRIGLGGKKPLIREFELISVGYNPKFLYINGRDISEKDLKDGNNLYNKINGAIHEICGLIPGKQNSAFIQVVGYLSKKMGEMEEPHLSYRLELKGSNVKIIEKSLLGERNFELLSLNSDKNLIEFIEEGIGIRKVFKQYKYEYNSENKLVYGDYPTKNETQWMDFSEFRIELLNYMKDAMSLHFNLRFNTPVILTNSELKVIEEAVLAQENKTDVAQPANLTRTNTVQEELGVFDKFCLWWMK